MSNNLISKLPTAVSRQQLIQDLMYIPQLGIYETELERLSALDNMYSFFLPNLMTIEIYRKITLAVSRSLSKKQTKQDIIQKNNNHRRIMQIENSGVIGGGDCFLVSGVSGIGKTSTIYKIIANYYDQIIDTSNPFQKIIPCMVVATPFDCSPKALLLEIIHKVDSILETNYTPKTTPTIDSLIGVVGQIALNHIGLLIIDEIQNIISHRSGSSLMRCITELTNIAGISICLVGTPECEPFFSEKEFLARRTLGLKYTAMSYDEEFKYFCKILWDYQPLLCKTEINEAYYEWLYEHSAGITANIITLIHDSQEYAITTGYEKLDITMLNHVYNQRMFTMHKHINPILSLTPTLNQKHSTSHNLPPQNETISDDYIISYTVKQSKSEGFNVIEKLKKYITISEISL